MCIYVKEPLSVFIRRVKLIGKKSIIFFFYLSGLLNMPLMEIWCLVCLTNISLELFVAKWDDRSKLMLSLIQCLA